jgi:predicted phosphodiesterase
MKQEGIKTIKVRDYRKLHPDMPSLKLARIIYNENNLQFTNVEDARSVLRRIEGKHGNNERKSMKNKDLIIENARPYNPYSLPESYAKDRTPIKLSMACNNILLISDLHIPYHDIQAITIALDFGKEQNVNTIFINGDLIDFSQISKFDSDLSKRNTKQEFDATKQFLVSLRAAFPLAEIYWLKGNHCIRWEKFLMQKVKEIWNDDYFSLEQRLNLNEQRVHLLDDKVLVKAGKLSITHGHHIMRGFFSPVNSARGVYMKAKQSTIIGHVHKVSTHSETDMDGNSVTTYSMGSLCEKRPDYSPLVSSYQHGFAHVLIDNNGDYHLKNYQIVKGKIF